MIKNTILVSVVVLGVILLTGCEKSNIQPETPKVTIPTEPKEEEIIKSTYRLKVYYTKLNLKDTSYTRIIGLGNEKVEYVKVVPEGDTSVLNFREGKYDLVDSTDYHSYNTTFKYIYSHYVYHIDNAEVFYKIYREGYIHKVVVELSGISGIDRRPKWMGDITKDVFLREFERHTRNLFEANFLKAINHQLKPRRSLYYIKDLITDPVDTEAFIEFKDVPVYFNKRNKNF